MSQPVIHIFTNFPTAVFQRDVIAGAREICDQRGYPVTVLEMPEAPKNINLMLRADRSVAGGLVITGVLPDAVLNHLHTQGIPLSLVGHQIPGGRIPGVMTNNRQGIAMLMEHLVVMHGRMRPVFIQGDMAQQDGIQRYTAFQQEVMRYNLQLPQEFILRGDFIAETAAASMQQFLAATPDFDALIASDYLMAEAAMQVIKASGRRIPEDVAVAGFGDGPEAAQAGLTTVAADVTELGRRAARQLIGQIEGLRIRGLTLLSTELIERATTRSEST
ncbi:MAG: substrate-binding domain-containing protein [Chloroflexi bacterium]|nr:substrate-binding domain-containing protein [Chloroflexota bacterium]